MNNSTQQHNDNIWDKYYSSYQKGSVMSNIPKVIVLKEKCWSENCALELNLRCVVCGKKQIIK